MPHTTHAPHTTRRFSFVRILLLCVGIGAILGALVLAKNPILKHIVIYRIERALPVYIDIARVNVSVFSHMLTMNDITLSIDSTQTLHTEVAELLQHVTNNTPFSHPVLKLGTVLLKMDRWNWKTITECVISHINVEGINIDTTEYASDDRGTKEFDGRDISSLLTISDIETFLEPYSHLLNTPIQTTRVNNHASDVLKHAKQAIRESQNTLKRIQQDKNTIASTITDIRTQEDISAYLQEIAALRALIDNEHTSIAYMAEQLRTSFSQVDTLLQDMPEYIQTDVDTIHTHASSLQERSSLFAQQTLSEIQQSIMLYAHANISYAVALLLVARPYLSALEFTIGEMRVGVGADLHKPQGMLMFQDISNHIYDEGVQVPFTLSSAQGSATGNGILMLYANAQERLRLALEYSDTPVRIDTQSQIDRLGLELLRGTGAGSITFAYSTLGTAIGHIQIILDDIQVRAIEGDTIGNAIAHSEIVAPNTPSDTLQGFPLETLIHIVDYKIDTLSITGDMQVQLIRIIENLVAPQIDTYTHTLSEDITTHLTEQHTLLLQKTAQTMQTLQRDIHTQIRALQKIMVENDALVIQVQKQMIEVQKQQQYESIRKQIPNIKDRIRDTIDQRKNASPFQ